MLLIGIAICFILVLAFLGYVESHWIAPGVLFCVFSPVTLAYMWNESLSVLYIAMAALFVSLYAAFGVGKLLRAMLDTSHKPKPEYKVRQF